jgi:hypothetical protein
MISYLKKCSIACLFIGGFALNIHAQTVDWSIPEEKNKFSFMKIIGQDEEGFFVLRSNISLSNRKLSFWFRKREYQVSYYGAKLNQMWTKIIEPSVKDAEICNVVFANDKMLAISSVVNKDAKQYTIYAQWIDSKGSYIGSAAQIDQVTYNKKDDIEYLEVFSSQDHEKLSFVFKSPNGKNRHDYNVAVVNADLKQVWKKELNINYDNKMFGAESFALSNDGSFYILGIAFHNKGQEKVPGQSGYVLEVYNPTQNQSSEIPINIEDKFLTDVGFVVDNLNKKIVVSGFYSDKTTFSTAGTFYISIDAATGLITKNNSQAFSDEFLAKFRGETRVNKGKELVNYSVDKLVLRNDGGIVIIAEAFYTSITSYYDPFSRSYVSRTNYHYNNIMVISVNADGSTDWPQVITKSQVSTEDGGFYSSYCMLTYEAKMFYLFNDYSGRSNRVQVFTITNKGSETHNAIFKESDNVIVIAKAGRQIDENTMVVPAERDGKLCFLKLTF